MIPYGRHSVSQADIDAVVNVLKSDWLTQGPMIAHFENTVAEKVGAEHAIAVNSATSALHIACLALGLGPGDWLWTSPNTFVASANCGVYCGARVDFVDIDPVSYNMSVDALADKLAQAEINNVLPKVVVPVHFSGQSCDMAGIYALSKRYGFRILEDASHAIGGKYRSEYVGSCRYSDIAVFSFHPVKIITTGEGGMALTNNQGLAKKLDVLRTHGITRDESEMTQPSDGPWYYQQLGLGFNYRMTDMQAALGVSQMQRLDEFIDKRHAISRRYHELLADFPVVLPSQDSACYSSMHLYVVRLQLDKIKASHRQVFESLRTNGIGVNLHYIPVHTQPYYQQMGFKPDDYPEANRYYSEAISLPLHPELTIEQQVTVVTALKEAIHA